MSSPVFIALRQLWSRKFLYGIATCGVMLGVFPLIAITGILRGFQGKFVETVLKNSAHVVLFSKELRRAPRYSTSVSVMAAFAAKMLCGRVNCGSRSTPPTP